MYNYHYHYHPKLRWILSITDEWWIRSSLRPLQIHQIHHSSLMGVMNQNSSWRTAELNLLWSQFTTRSSPTDRRLHNDALNTSAPDSQRMLVPSNQSRRIVIALENVEILRQEKQSCARRGSWSSLPSPPWRTSHTALFPSFSIVLNPTILFFDLSCFKSTKSYTESKQCQATERRNGDPPIRKFRPVRSRAKFIKR